jgi:Tfp pilus assembly protein PilN
MINLLPPAVKDHYRYALRNVRLRHWAFGVTFALVGLLAIGGAGYVYMQQISNSYAKQINTSTASLEAQNLTKTQTQVKDISGSLKLAVQVLSKEILFSQLLKQLGAVIPANAVLSNLTISQDQSAIDITAKATDYNAATQVQVNLSDPKNKVFSKADIVNISCAANTNTSATSVDAKYPCTVTIRALLAGDTQFLFINNGKK